MRAVEQTTLAKTAFLSGTGLHGGRPCRVALRPARADSGVVFRLAKKGAAATFIPAIAASVSDTRLSTTLGAAGAGIGTVEHLMAALMIAGIDNLLVDVSGPELPILDGSAAPFVAAIERAGVKRLPAAREQIKLMAPLEVADGDRMIRAEPYDGRLLNVAIDFDDAAIGAQSLSLDLDDAAAMRRLAQARTFCRLADVDAMRAAGLGQGGSLENAIVVDGGRILNAEGLRDPAEFALHKALDLIGDLKLAGAPILARIEARRPGHDLNVRFVRRLLAERAAHERIVAPAPETRASA